MARRTGSKNELIECEYCGEKYSATYRHCPFCNEDGTGRWDDPDTPMEEYDLPVRGGKRLAGHRSSQAAGYGEGMSIGRIIGLVVSLALIVAAIWIVCSVFRSLRGKTPDPVPSNSAAVQSVAPTAPVQSEAGVSEPPVVSQPPAPTAGIPTVNVPAVTGFTLNREDFTFDAAGQTFQMQASLTPADAHAEVAWKSSNPNVASVSWNGMVTAVAPGTATLTATVEGVGEKKCIVRCNFSSGAASTQPSPAPSATQSENNTSLTLSREDFTLSKAGESWRLRVTGTSSAVTWASSKPEVATVSADGTVTAVSKGTCTVTATVDGVTLKCIVRCSF